MAVATERECGLFINGATAEPASGDVRQLTEPATGEPLARAARVGLQDVDRAGGEPEGKGAFYPPTVLAKVDNRMVVDVLVSTSPKPFNPFKL